VSDKVLHIHMFPYLIAVPIVIMSQRIMEKRNTERVLTIRLRGHPNPRITMDEPLVTAADLVSMAASHALASIP